MRTFEIEQKRKEELEQQGRGLCPLSQAVNLWATVKSRRPKGQPLPMAVCAGGACAWWAGDCCAVLAVAEPLLARLRAVFGL